MPPLMSIDCSMTRAPSLPDIEVPSGPHAPRESRVGLLPVVTIATALAGLAGLAVMLLPIAYGLSVAVVVGILLWRLGQKITAAGTVQDSQTAQWLADLRDPSHVPVGGTWVGVNQGDRCAVGWLLERTGGQWQVTLNGVSHTSYRDVCDKYGKALIDDVVDMNDRGMPWPRIATRIERRTRRL